MLRLRPFQWKRPTSIAQVLSLLATHGKKARIYAGGTDLMPNMKLAQIDAEVVISLGGIPELEGIIEKEHDIWIGVRTAIQDVIVHPEFQKLGLGSKIMQSINGFLSSNCHSGTTVGLLAAKGKEDFYLKHGFVLRNGKDLGLGMCRFI